MTVMAMLMAHWYYVGFELCLLQTRGPRDRQGLQPLPGKPGINYTAVLTIAAAIYCLQLMFLITLVVYTVFFVPGAKIVFPEGEDAQQYINRVIECSWDAEKEAWVYMRERRDKDTPNAYHVYEKVVQSITDDLNQDVLLGHITKVLQAPLYDKDEGRASQARGPA